MTPIRRRAPRAALLTAALLIAALLSGGCGRQATLTDRQGRQHEGIIVGGDATHVHLVHGEWSSEPRRIARDTIVEIDHPGDGAFWTGFGFTALGAIAAIALVAQVGDSDDPTGELMGGAMVLAFYGGIGIPLLAWGHGVNRDSKDAARAAGGDGAARVQPFITPTGIGVRF